MEIDLTLVHDYLKQKNGMKMLNDFMKKILEEDLENKQTRVKRTLGF
jgi:hypothetical protein